MLFGVHLPNSGPFAFLEALVSVARAAESLGYDAVQPHDHITWGMEDKYHFYCGAAEAADARERPTDFLDAMTAMSYLAGVTSRVKLIPSALCLAWRDPTVFARQALTLHQLSKGRFVLNVCVGNIRNDFNVVGAPWEERGKIAVEKLKFLRLLIDGEGPISFQGNYVKIEGAEMNPRPRGLPLWYAGTSEAAVRRAARYCEGWWPAASPEYFRAKIPEIYRLAAEAGRGDVRFQFGSEAFTCVGATDDEAWRLAEKTIDAHSKSEWMQRHDAEARKRRAPLVGSPQTVATAVREYESAGATRLNLCFIGRTLDEVLEQMEMFAREVVPLAAS